MTASPNAAQLATAAQYSAPVASWAVKLGEYSDENEPFTGYAMIATLENGWAVTIGRYGAVLAEIAPAEQAFEPTVADDLEMETRRAIRQACKAHEGASLSGDQGEDAYGDLLSALRDFSERLPRLIAEVEALQTHHHAWNEQDYCNLCGADGRA
jgi:hypothetical protein